MVRDDINNDDEEDGSTRGKDFELTDEESASDDRAGSDGPGPDEYSDDWDDVDTSHLPDMTDATGNVDLTQPVNPVECPRCGQDFDSERGMKIHFGSQHKDFEITDDLEVVDATEDDDSDSDSDQPVLEGGPVTPDDEDGDGSESLEDRQQKRDAAGKTVDDHWDDARDKYREAAVNGSETRRRDARGYALNALEAETSFMSVRERSDGSDHDFWVWTDDDGWAEDYTTWVREKMDAELGTDGDSTESEKAIHHLAVRGKVNEDDLNGADYDGTLVAFENGVLKLESVEYDAETGTIDAGAAELIEEEPEHRMTRRLPMKWDPDAADLELAETWMNDLAGDDEMKARTMWEGPGHALLPRYDPQGFLALIGDGSNGKTTLFNILGKTLGESNTTAIPLDKITSSQFSAYRMVDRLANIHADISGANLGDVSALKAATGDDRMEVEKKGIDPWDARNRAIQIMGMNSAPAIVEQNKAVKRRLLPIIMDVEFERDPDPDNPNSREKDDDIKEKLLSDEGRAALAVKYVEAARRLQEQGEFTMALELEEDERMRLYQSQGDPVADFERECLERDPDGPGIAIDDIKACYDAFSRDMDHPSKTRGTLTKMLKKRQTTVMRRSDPRSWTDGDGRIGIYKGMKFSQKAKENWLPEDAHWHKYGRPDGDDAGSDTGEFYDDDDGMTRVTVSDVRDLDEDRYDSLGVKVEVAHELDPRPWLHDEAVLADDDTIRVQSIGEHTFETGATYVIRDFNVVPDEGGKQMQVVPSQTDVLRIETTGSQTGLGDSDDDDDDDGDGVNGIKDGFSVSEDDYEGPMNVKEALKTTTDDMHEGEGDAPAAEDVIGRVADDHEVSEDTVKHVSEKLKQKGELYEPATGHWRTT